MLITTSSVGLPIITPVIFIASAELNNWCQADCDFSKQPKLELSEDTSLFQIEGANLLSEGVEFKLVIPSLGAANAAQVYANRMNANLDVIGGVHVDRRFDFDPNTGHFWLLACGHPVIRKGHWNQNNVYGQMKCDHIQV